MFMFFALALVLATNLIASLTANYCEWHFQQTSYGILYE